MKKSWIISVLMLLCLYAEAQILIVPREKLEQTTNPRLSVYAGALKFEHVSLQAPQMNEDDPVSIFAYPFKNVSKDTLVISKLVSTCSCATVSSDKMLLSPGEEGEILVRYNPKGHPGKFERRVFVYVGEDEAPSAILRLNVDVEMGSDLSGYYPVSMGRIRLRRSEIELTKGVKAVERCVFVNVSDSSLRLECEKGLLPSCLTFRTEPSVVPSGGEGEIVIEYDPSKGEGRDRMVVMLKGLGVPPSQSAIVVTLMK